MLAATGFECAGCGGTRAVAAVFHGSFTESINLNAIVVGLPILLALGFGIRKMSSRGVNRIDSFYVVATLLITWTVVRNLPQFRFLLASS